jgi:hypothetical protein
MFVAFAAAGIPVTACGCTGKVRAFPVARVFILTVPVGLTSSAVLFLLIYVYLC